MNSIFYTADGFFDPTICAVPEGAVEVTEQEHAELLAAQTNGARIQPGADGRPVAIAPPALTHADLVARARTEIRLQRQPIIQMLDGLQSSAIVRGASDQALAIETAKQGLRDLTDIDLGACNSLEAMTSAVKARYAQLAAALPLEVRKAFSEALS